MKIIASGIYESKSLIYAATRTRGRSIAAGIVYGSCSKGSIEIIGSIVVAKTVFDYCIARCLVKAALTAIYGGTVICVSCLTNCRFKSDSIPISVLHQAVDVNVIVVAGA